MLLKDIDIRLNIDQPNGAMCDICGKIMEPFTYVKLTGMMTHPGRRYPQVSSDLTTKTLNTRHLCLECYQELLKQIDSHLEEQMKLMR